MSILSDIGRIFYGAAIGALGILTIFHRDLPYMLIPPKHVWINDHVLIVYVSGVLLFLAGLCIVFDKRSGPVCIVLGAVLLSIFGFYFIPYELLSTSTYMHFGTWENAAKELALAGGAFVIARRYFGTILFSWTILSFGIDHILYASQAAGYIPAWVSNHLFWMYFTGSALIGSSTAILLKIRPRVFAALLGTMILIWVIILHIPKVAAAGASDQGGEVTSAFLALAYCGIAFAIAGK